MADENKTRHEWLVLDGEVLQKNPIDVLKEPEPLKLVIGTTAHESHSDKLLHKYTQWTPELVRKHIQESVIGQKGLTDEVLKRYNATYQGLVKIVSDIRTVCPLLVIARSQQSVPFYVVTQTGGDLEIADVDADIQAILGRYEPKTFQQRRYASAIQQLFYHYVSHGELKQYEPRRRVLDVGQDALSVEDYPNCDFWIKEDIVPRYARID
ncbi:neurotactin-like [Sitodiplosis mosellana]|uniref:neurotactin-like n=1 Tax=Sitodiplosis mosellana TaxID=263140 RepID=UPI002444159E|nr:neurotactin-like [Sitodiplosis mosellana]